MRKIVFLTLIVAIGIFFTLPNIYAATIEQRTIYLKGSTNLFSEARNSDNRPDKDVESLSGRLSLFLASENRFVLPFK